MTIKFSKVSSNSCCSLLFEPGIINICLLSHKIYSNNVLNFQECTTILNACIKKVCELIECTTYIYIYIYMCVCVCVCYLLLQSFSDQCELVVFHWSLSDSKSPQVSRTLLSILADLNNSLVWMVSTRPLISKSPSPFINPSITVPIIIGINVTFKFHSFFNSLATSRFSSLFSFSFNFTLQSAGTAKSTIWQVFFFFFFFLDCYKV